MAEKKEKRYVSDNAQLMAEWDWEKNKDFDPSQLTLGSNRKVWWVCSEGHKWEARVASRSCGSGCPYCSGRKVLAGYNDLETLNPQLALEWNYEKNKSLLPTEVATGSGKKVWWKCSKGHEWQAVISSRHNGVGCPVCSNKAVQAGFNDLATCNPELAKEWNYVKNGDLLPTMVTTNSGKKVWWLCSRGHEWQATVDHRTNSRGCPICLTDRRSSFPEQAIFYYLSKAHPDTYSRYKLKGKYELDIFIPEINIAIEYDGVFFHASEKATNNEKRKNAVCYNEKILLIRIKEDKSAEKTYVERWNQYLIKIIFNPERDYINLQSVLMQIMSILREKDISIPLDIEVERDKIEILALLKQSDVADNVEERCPQIAAEWNYEKNGRLLPSSFAWASNQKVWWRCPKGHEYQAKISNRTVLNRGCPICAVHKRSESKHKRNVEKNNFQKYCYEHNKEFLLDEWDIRENGGKTPNDYSTGNGQPVWWLCKKCGYKWKASIPNRIKGTGCPQCYILRRKEQKNKNSVSTDNSLVIWCHKNNRMELLSEWNNQKNLNPSENYTYGSHAKVWWKCNVCGNEWESEIKSRTSGRGCPKCAKEKRNENK